MNRLSLNRSILAAGVALVILATGCGRTTTTTTPTSSATPTQTQPTTSTTPTTTVVAGPSGQLTVAVTTMGQGRFEPPTATPTDTGQTLLVMFDSMFGTEKGVLTPGIVEKWEVAADGLSFVYHVRQGVKFHNGDDLTAADVAFSIEQYMRKDAWTSETRNMVQKVELVDEYTVRVYTQGTQPYLPYSEGLVSPSQSIVMPKKYIEAKGWAYAESHPIGSGPYKFVRRAAGDFVEWEALDQHWRRVPDFKKLTMILMPEEATTVASIKTGTVDVGSISLDSAPGLESAGFDTVPLIFGVPMVQLYGNYVPKAASLPTADVRVRKALAISINRDDIIKNFFYGKAGAPIPPWFTETSLEIDASYWKDYCAQLYKYDPDQAKQLLKEAGYADGFSFKFYTYTQAGGAFVPKLAEIIADNWRSIGVNAQLTPVDYALFQTWRKGPADPLIGQVSIATGASAFFAPRSLTIAFYSTGTYNLVGKAMPELDKLIDSAYAEADPAKRKELLAQAIKIGTDTYTSFEVSSVPVLIAVSHKVDPSGWTLPTVAPYLGIIVPDTKRK